MLSQSFVGKVYWIDSSREEEATLSRSSCMENIHRIDRIGFSFHSFLSAFVGIFFGACHRALHRAGNELTAETWIEIHVPSVIIIFSTALVSLNEERFIVIKVIKQKNSEDWRNEIFRPAINISPDHTSTQKQSHFVVLLTRGWRCAQLRKIEMSVGWHKFICCCFYMCS